MNPTDPQIPPTEAEIAEIMRLPEPVRGVVRRLAFQRDRLLARVRELEEDIKTYEEDERERRTLTDTVRDDAKKALRCALGKQRWDQFWGPELEALASVVYEVWRQRAVTEARVRELEAERGGLRTACDVAKVAILGGPCRDNPAMRDVGLMLERLLAGPLPPPAEPARTGGAP